MNKNLAPIAIFVYNRLNNTKQVVEALQKNRLASETEVYFFSDGPKNENHVKAVQEVRAYLKTVTGFKKVTIIERPENYYIERNITEGVTEIINKHGKIIVMEDDGVSAPSFLEFMNKALDIYDPYKKVMHIATFTFINMPKDFNKTFFWSYSENTGGGWATWKDRWNTFTWFKTEAEALSHLTPEKINKIELDGQFKCLGSLKLNPIPWDICWNIAIIEHDGLAVNSPHSLIKNNGLFNGTHTGVINRLLGKHPMEVSLISDTNIEFNTTIEENTMATQLLKDFYAGYGRRKRDRIVSFFVRILVFLKITKLLKKILKR